MRRYVGLHRRPRGWRRTNIL